MHGQTGFGVARGADMKKENVRALADHIEQNVKDGYDQKYCDKCIMAHAANLGGHDGTGARTPKADEFLGIKSEELRFCRLLYVGHPLGHYDPDYKDAVAVLRYFSITGILDWTIAPGYRKSFYKDRCKAEEEQ